MYDFTTLVDRRNTGSSKWNSMLKTIPNLPQDVVPLSVADMELKNPPQIIEGLKEYLNTCILGYTDGTPSYYESICNWMQKRHHWKIEPEQIFPTLSVVAALQIAICAFLQPGDSVLLMTPVYYPFFHVLEQYGMKQVNCPLLLEGTKYTIDFSLLENLAKRPEVKAIVLCNPHNPVGRVWTKEELTHLGKICIDHNVLVISDEIHFDFAFPGHVHTSFASISPEFSEHSVVLASASKSFNLAGIQNAYAVIQNPSLAQKYEATRKHLGLEQPNALGYRACEIAYTQCEDWLDELLIHLQKNRDFLVRYLQEYIPQIHPIPLEGTYLQWLDCRELFSSAQEQEHFFQEKAHLFLDEGYIFGEEGKGFARVNLACPTQVLEKAFTRLKDALNQR